MFMLAMCVPYPATFDRHRLYIDLCRLISIWVHNSFNLGNATNFYNSLTQAKKAKQAEIDRKRAEVRRRMEEASKAKKAKKGFMTPERKKKLRVWIPKFVLVKIATRVDLMFRCNVRNNSGFKMSYSLPNKVKPFVTQQKGTEPFWIIKCLNENCKYAVKCRENI